MKKDREITIQLTLTEDDLLELERKVGYDIGTKQDAYEAVFEAISTFLEL